MLGKSIGTAVAADQLLVCTRSTVIGRIDFDGRWHDGSVTVIAASALRGVQETLVLAKPGAELRTTSGKWEVTWNGFEIRKSS